MLKIALLATALAAVPSFAFAEGKPQSVCLPTKDAVKALAERGEKMKGAGKSVTGVPAMLFLNERTGTWTIVTSTKDGKGACLQVLGGGFKATVPGIDV